MNKDTLFSIYIPTIFRSLENIKLASATICGIRSDNEEEKDAEEAISIEDCLHLALFCFDNLIGCIRKGISVTLLMSMGFPVVCAIHPASVEEFKGLWKNVARNFEVNKAYGLLLHLDE